MTALQIFHALAGLVVLIEAVNKLERSCPFASGLSAQKRTLEILKAIAWWPVALGAAGAVAGPVFHFAGSDPNTFFHLLRVEHPTLSEVLVLFGMAVMIVRTRVKEG